MTHEEWAEQFKAAPNCETCPFVRNEADVGIGVIRVCDSVCTMSADEIVKYMEA